MQFEPLSSTTERVGQLKFGDPAITTGDSHCSRDFFANAVTCAPGNSRFGALNFQLGDGTDNVQYANSSAEPPSCLLSPVRPMINVTADLGPAPGRRLTRRL